MIKKLILIQDNISGERHCISEAKMAIESYVKEQTELFENTNFFKILKEEFPSSNIKLEYIDEDYVEFCINEKEFCISSNIMETSKEDILKEIKK